MLLPISVCYWSATPPTGTTGFERAAHRARPGGFDLRSAFCARYNCSSCSVAKQSRSQGLVRWPFASSQEIFHLPRFRIANLIHCSRFHLFEQSNRPDRVTSENTISMADVTRDSSSAEPWQNVMRSSLLSRQRVLGNSWRGARASGPLGHVTGHLHRVATQQSPSQGAQNRLHSIQVGHAEVRSGCANRGCAHSAL